MADDQITVIQMSDLHLHPDKADTIAGWRAAVERVTRYKPDLVIITGDLTDDGRDEPELTRVARREVDNLPWPVHTVPGNHDVGNKASHTNAPVTAPMIDTWRDIMGGDRFSVAGGGWRLIGLNTQIVGSGLPHEKQQNDWFKRELAACAADGLRPAVFMHMPMFVRSPNERFDDDSSYWPIDPEPRAAMLGLLDAAKVSLLANGHVHWHQRTTIAGREYVWCPPVQKLFVDDPKFRGGGALTGFMHYTFTPDGYSAKLIELGREGHTVYWARRELALPAAGTGAPPPAVTLARLLLDFTGTLSKDGRLIDGVAPRIKSLAEHIRITVLTADTFGTAEEALAGLPIEFQRIETGRDKVAYLKRIGAEHTIAIGNGRNDVGMVQAAAIGIAVAGPEGAAGELIVAANVVVTDICNALDLVAEPLRLKATLRG